MRQYTSVLRPLEFIRRSIVFTMTQALNEIPVVCIDSVLNMLSPSASNPGHDVNLATSMIFTANGCLVVLCMHFLTTLNGPLQNKASCVKSDEDR